MRLEENEMLLNNKNAVVYGGAGSIGATVARAFASAGARVHLAGRTRATLDEVAASIRSGGGFAETAQVDALDERAVDEYVDAVAAKAGSVDISFNAISHGDVQGTPLAHMELADFMRPITTAMQTQFLTTRAAARHMVRQGSGVILAFGGSDNYPIPNLGGTLVTFDAIESLRRVWACELGPKGIRVITLVSAGVPDPDRGELVPGSEATGEGGVADGFLAEMRDRTMLKRLPSMTDVGNVAVFVASDQASAVTAATVNITCGAIVD